MQVLRPLNSLSSLSHNIPQRGLPPLPTRPLIFGQSVKFSNINDRNSAARAFKAINCRANGSGIISHNNLLSFLQFSCASWLFSWKRAGLLAMSILALRLKTLLLFVALTEFVLYLVNPQQNRIRKKLLYCYIANFFSNAIVG